MKDKGIQVLLATNYYDHSQIQEVAARTGATAVIVPANTGGAPNVNTYFDLMNLWVSSLASAFGGSPPSGRP